MARLSTGQSYGDTNRSTAAQLLGGIPTDATSGAIAQSEINEPALRPQASPVSTFQQVGAPTIGGPVRFFAPPDLPAPSQDMARIAAALGNFSPVLANLGESYVQRKKQEDARAQAAGQAAAQQLAMTAPGQDFIAARDNLWRKAQAGDAGALAAYQQLQALSPLQQAYAQRYAGQAVLREDINTATDRFKAIPDIGGTPIDEIPPGDPRLSAAMASLYRVPANDPAGFAELMPQIAVKNGEISRAHMTMHTARKAQVAGAATQADTVSRFSGNPNAADVAAGVTRQLNAARQSLGVEQYQEQLQAMPDMLVTAVAANSVGPDGRPDARRFQALAGVAQQALGNIRIGPNGQESLLNAYGAKGGAAMQLDLQQKLLKKFKELTTTVDAFAGSAGEDLGHQVASITKVGDPSLTPAERDAALARGAAMITAQTSNPQERAAAMSALNSTFSASQTAFTGPMQREAERTIMFDYAKDPATEIERIRSLRRSGQLPVEAANRIEANYRSLQGAEMRPWVRASQEAVELAMQAEIKAVKLPKSDGDMVITDKERRFLIERRAELTGDVEKMRLKALSDGSGVAGYRAQLDTFTKALLPKAPKPANRDMKEMFASPEAWKTGLGAGNAAGRGNPQANSDLARRVDTGLVMGLPAFERNFTAWIERGEMSDAMKLMIKRSGYGAKPSEFWRKQWRNQYGDAYPMPAQYQQVMPMRDQMKVSYQPATGTTQPTAQLASNLSSFWQGLATSAANALMAPAAAATMPMGAMGQVSLGTPVVGTPKLNANAKAWLAAISAGGFEGAGYNTYYGGGAFDNTKGHPMRVVRPPGGIPSSAAGRYQFMPDTWTGLHGGKNPPMTPANQDAGAYQLALNRGVDLNTAPLTIENVRKLAPVWAALPVNATGGAGFYKGQGGAGFARFKQTWETERRRYQGAGGPQAQAQPNENLGNQLTAQLESQSGYEDTTGPAVQRKPWAGEAGAFASKGSFQNGLDAINKAGASVMGFSQGKPNDIKLVAQFYSKNPEVANQYDLPVNLFVRYISGIGAKGLQVSQEQGRKVLSQIEAAKQIDPAIIVQGMAPAVAASYKRNIAKGMIPITNSSSDKEINLSLGRFWAMPQKDGSYLVTEDFDFASAPKAQGGDDKRNARARQADVIPPSNPLEVAGKLVRGGFGKPFKYTLRISPDGRVQVNP